MSRLTALLKKEWRDARPLAIGAAIAAPVMSIGVQLIFLHFQDPSLSARFVVPGLVALFVGAVASDLVAGDVASRRIAAIASLPASPLLAWAAKVLFLLLVAVPFALWAFASELAIFAMAKGANGAGALFGDAPVLFHALFLVVPLACCVLFFSTILDRGLAAFLAGVAVVVGVHYGLIQLVIEQNLERKLTTAGFVGFELALSVACLAGSAAAFRFGELHLASRARRLVVGFGAIAVMLAVPATSAAMALRRWSSFGPDNPDVRIEQLALSPDETRIAVGVTKSSSEKTGGVWLVDIATSRIIPIEEGHSGLALVQGDAGELLRAWTPEGRLRVARWKPKTYFLAEGTSFAELDLATRAETNAQTSDAYFAKLRPFGWARIDPVVGGPWPLSIEWPERGLRREIRKPSRSGKEKFERSWATALPTPGHFIWCDEDKLLREDLATGTSTVLVTEGAEHFNLSPDGTRAIVWAERYGHPRVVDVDDGHMVLELRDDPPRMIGWAGGHHGSRMIVQQSNDSNAPVLIDLHDGSRVVLPSLDAFAPIEIARDGRIFVVRFDHALEVLDTTGRRLRRLWEPPR